MRLHVSLFFLRIKWHDLNQEDSNSKLERNREELAFIRVQKYKVTETCFFKKMTMFRNSQVSGLR